MLWAPSLLLARQSGGRAEFPGPLFCTGPNPHIIFHEISVSTWDNVWASHFRHEAWDFCASMRKTPVRDDLPVDAILNGHYGTLWKILVSWLLSSRSYVWLPVLVYAQACYHFWPDIGRMTMSSPTEANGTPPRSKWYKFPKGNHFQCTATKEPYWSYKIWDLSHIFLSATWWHLLYRLVMRSRTDSSIGTPSTTLESKCMHVLGPLSEERAFNDFFN